VERGSPGEICISRNKTGQSGLARDAVSCAVGVTLRLPKAHSLVLLLGHRDFGPLFLSKLCLFLMLRSGVVLLLQWASLRCHKDHHFP